MGAGASSHPDAVAATARVEALEGQVRSLQAQVAAMSTTPRAADTGTAAADSSATAAAAAAPTATAPDDHGGAEAVAATDAHAWATDSSMGAWPELKAMWDASGGANDAPAARPWSWSRATEVVERAPGVEWRPSPGIAGDKGAAEGAATAAAEPVTLGDAVLRINKTVQLRAAAAAEGKPKGEMVFPFAVEVPVGKGKGDWGATAPFDRVIDCSEALAAMSAEPYAAIARQSICIVEPARDVGTNGEGEPVRASQNVAYLLQRGMDLDSVCLPLWRAGVLNPAALMPVLFNSLGVVVEGGYPSTFAATEWPAASPRDDLLELTQALLVMRSLPNSPTTLFICVGHQLAAETHPRLLRRLVKQVAAATTLDTEGTGVDADGAILAQLKAVCARIHEVGSAITTEKAQSPVTGYESDGFAVAPNKAKEVATARLLQYKTPESHGTIPDEVLQVHRETVGMCPNTMERLMAFSTIDISMFHGDKVNEEGIIFANWAYVTLRDLLAKPGVADAVRACPSLRWTTMLPANVEVVASTQVTDGVMTEVACTAIYYLPIGRKHGDGVSPRRCNTLQFHPELFPDLRDVNHMESAPQLPAMAEHDGTFLMYSLLAGSMESSTY